jgi:lysophospholipase L1-like esterase
MGETLPAVQIKSASPAAVDVQPLPPMNTDAAKAAASDEVISRLDELAAETEFPTATRIVCVGDSITEPGFPAGVMEKYPELLRAAYQRRSDSMIEVVNAGKGGDSISRVCERAEAEIVARHPTIVTINVGINDSKLLWPEFVANFVPIDRFEEDYRALIATIRSRCGATVIVLGPIACIEAWAAAATKGPTPVSYFAKRQELDRFNDCARTVAASLGCDFIDLHALFAAQPNLEALFNEPDGVHTNTRGQELIALELASQLRRKHPRR